MELAPNIEILSKEDAREVFAMTGADWVENVRRAVEAGQAEATGTLGSVAMHVPTKTGFISIRPDHNGQSGSTPDFIQVLIAYRQHVSDEALLEAIEAAQNQLKPEYEVLASIEKMMGGVALFLTIMAVQNLT